MSEPHRGFGRLWREQPGLREQLGWAVTPKDAGTAERQAWSSGGSLLAIPYATDDPRRGFFFLYVFALDKTVERVSR